MREAKNVTVRSYVRWLACRYIYTLILSPFYNYTVAILVHKACTSYDDDGSAQRTEMQNGIVACIIEVAPSVLAAADLPR